MKDTTYHGDLKHQLRCYPRALKKHCGCSLLVESQHVPKLNGLGFWAVGHTGPPRSLKPHEPELRKLLSRSEIAR